MGYNNQNDIRGKFIELEDELPKGEINVEIRQRLVQFAHELGEDVENNKKILKQVKDFVFEVRKKYDDEDLLAETLKFADSYIKTEVSLIEDDKDSSIPLAFLKSLHPNASNKIIKVDFKFSLPQLKTIVMDYYHETGKLVFPISKGVKRNGRVVGVLRNGNKAKIPVVTLHKIIGGEHPQYAPFIFGDIPSRKSQKGELSGYFYIYRFAGENDELYTLLSDKKLSLQSYCIEGSEFEVNDSSLIAETSKIPVKYKVLFLHNAKPHVIQFKDHNEFFSFCEDKKIEENKLLDYVVSIKDGRVIKVFSHPKWFLQLLLIFLIHVKKGETDRYPLHLLWIAERGTGKTTFLEVVMQKFKEKIIDGSTSTLKFLIPSFKERNNPEVGELAKAHRLVIVDEFFRMLLKSKNNERNIEAARMNTLLEHKERAAGSGHGATIVKMTARLMATTNPVSGTNNIYNLLDKFDDSFLSRMLIYYQLPEHMKFINDAKKSRFKSSDYWIEEHEFVSLVDYLSSFDAEYDWNRLIELFEKFSLPLSQEVKGMFEARYLHHMECILDGIIKMRCMFKRDSSFKVKEEDYIMLEYLFGKIISSWFGDTQDIVLDVSIPQENRLPFLPEYARVILEILMRLGFSAKIAELKKACLSEMKEDMFYSMLSVLRTGHFVYENGVNVEHYAFKVEGSK